MEWISQLPLGSGGVIVALIAITGIVFKVADWSIDSTKIQSDAVTQSDKEWIERLETRIRSVEEELQITRKDLDLANRRARGAEQRALRAESNYRLSLHRERLQQIRLTMLIQHLRVLKVPIPEELLETGEHLLGMEDIGESDENDAPQPETFTFDHESDK